MAPIPEMNGKVTHAPDRLMSCSLRTDTARVGKVKNSRYMNQYHWDVLNGLPIQTK